METAKGVNVDEMDDIVQEFLVESHENLDQLDQDLVALEANPGSRDLLSSIFRTIHTIKGTSGFLAFNRLERVTHVGESLLSRLRDGAQAMTPQVADALLRMVDVVRVLLTSIEEQGGEGDADIDQAVAAVPACISDSSAASAAAARASSGSAAPPSAVPVPPAPSAPAPNAAAATGVPAAGAPIAGTPEVVVV